MLKKLTIPTEARKIWLMLICTDALFVFLHTLHFLPPIRDAFPIFDQDAFKITHDLSMSESFQYIKEFWIILLVLGIVIWAKNKAYLPLALAFGYLLPDDMLGFHEWAGENLPPLIGLDSRADMPFGLLARDYGELAITATVGFLLVLVFFLAYRSGDASVRQVYHYMFAMLVLLVVFGVGFDFVIRLVDSWKIREVIKIFEEGGEMVTMSTMCWYIFALNERLLKKN
jgi:hypothetical protein